MIEANMILLVLRLVFLIMPSVEIDNVLDAV